MVLKRKKELNKEKTEEQLYVKNFIDMVVPSVLKFYPSHYVFGNTYRQVIAIKNYPIESAQTALLKKFGERKNITVKIIAEKMNPLEYEKLLESYIRKNKAETYEKKQIGQIKADVNLKNTVKIISQLTERPDLSMFEVTAYIELIATSLEELKKLKVDVLSRLDSISYDDMYLKQKEGFLAVNPVGNYKNEEFSRHMDTESLCNLFPFSYSGKIDKEGFALGEDRYGGNIIIDFDKREKSRTNSNILILGNSGEGKSFTVKLIVTDWRLKSKKIILLDPELEYKELTENLGGYYIDLMEGKYILNILEVRRFSEGLEDNEDEKELSNTFSSSNTLSQHLSFLRDFFKTYKEGLSERLLDCLEIFLIKTYKKFGIDFDTDLSNFTAKDFPILSDLYEIIDDEFNHFDEKNNNLFNKKLLEELRLALNSICIGSESKYFNGHTNVSSYDFISFGVKGLMDISSATLRNAMLFNILTYMTNKLLNEGNTVAVLDEFYLFLDNITMVRYVRNYSKRVRKKESAIVISSQNIEDYLLKDIAEYTKPLFAIPTYKFLFFPGTIDKKTYCSLLNLNESEFGLIRTSNKGNCLFIAGNEKFNLQVKASRKKVKLFGTQGGR